MSQNKFPKHDESGGCEDIGCAILIAVFFILFCLGVNWAGNERHTLNFHGQIIQISPTSRGYMAFVQTDHSQEGAIFTVEQANAFKAGDIIDFTEVYDGWGYPKGTESIRKVK